MMTNLILKGLISLTETKQYLKTDINSVYQYSFTRDDYINAFTQWYHDYLKHEMSLFAVTATAQAGYSTRSHTKARPEKYKSSYQAEVVKQVRKRLSRSNDYLMLHDHYYEHEDQTKREDVDWAKPHHIHGILVFPKTLERKIWIAEKEEISNQLKGGFNTLKTYRNILIEPIYNITGWLQYITKRKDFNDNI